MGKIQAADKYPIRAFAIINRALYSALAVYGRVIVPSDSRVFDRAESELSMRTVSSIKDPAFFSQVDQSTGWATMGCGESACAQEGDAKL